MKDQRTMHADGLGRCPNVHRGWRRTAIGASWVMALAMLLPGARAWPQSSGSTPGSHAADPNRLATADDPDERDGLGRATRHLLSLQVSGAAAGPAQPMTGDATSAAYKRYSDTFTHPVPEFFQQRVRSDNSGGS
ncbi:DUF3613 domain-containing protein [Robbsia andropogonis]|uniref:DUF3613 domain-containing protein n=1 Tax=Robbsia andropogonis TaxID=28092 RepID=UPI000B23996B|nr:DUF3613 domain-containing protein [Robbsia andropogonis]MCP1117558.1 DUF3613 domain-containing protein [Robbsia andropogonis]MCP1127024.1 DUF3613 domain-containing protein [Robbsia andropogonis]